MKNKYKIDGETTTIFLRRKTGEIIPTVIDTKDLEIAKSFKGTWCASSEKNGVPLYVRGSVYSKEKSTTVFLHRLLFDNPKGLVIDHINHNPLDNKRSNLRVITQGQNTQNVRGAYKNSSSKIRGVRFHKKNEKWEARLQINKKPVAIGYFDTAEDAERAIKKARKEQMPFSSN